MQLQFEPASSVVQLRCASCRAIFDGELPVMVPVSVAVEAMLALRCASCGGKEILLGQNRSAPEDDQCRKVPPNASLDARIQDWLRTGEKGQSADAIFAHMAGGDRSDGWAHPQDASDLHRSMLLLRRIPEWTFRMAEMSARTNAWATLIDAWPTILATFNEEAGPDLGKWPRPRTASLLEKILSEDRTSRPY
ncbi:hypothetical protein ACVIGB_000928 [Bradyrhizobium sp. USDA 4341]